jgi:hypothetical protein
MGGDKRVKVSRAYLRRWGKGGGRDFGCYLKHQPQLSVRSILTKDIDSKKSAGW